MPRSKLEILRKELLESDAVNLPMTYIAEKAMQAYADQEMKALLRWFLWKDGHQRKTPVTGLINHFKQQTGRL